MVVKLVLLVLALTATVCSGSSSVCHWSVVGPRGNGSAVVDCRPEAIGYEFLVDGGSDRSDVQTLTIRCQNGVDQSFLSSRSFIGFTQLVKLNIDGCGVATLPPVFQSLRQLKSLVVRTYSEHTNLVVEESAFQSLRALERLDLSSNRLQYFGQHTFCNSDKLILLNVSNNAVHNLDGFGLKFQPSNESSTCTLHRLRSVDMSGNSITVIPDRAFLKITGLNVLSLRSNRLELIEETALLGLASLRVIDMSSNRLASLPEDVFKPSPNLTSIQLSNNAISTLKPHIFRGLLKLTNLDLSRNQLTSTWINSNTFSNLTNLHHLDLSYNQLSQLDSSIFADLSTLRVLHLHHNAMDSIPSGSFSNLSSLNALVISNNRLRNIKKQSFIGLSDLRNLDISNNYVEFVKPDALRDLFSLESLVLRNNRIRTLDDIIVNLHTLRLFDISYNLISNLDKGSLQNLTLLEHLDLTGNQLTRLSGEALSGLVNLHVLDLCCNNIAHIERNAFEQLTSVEVIRLDNNLLTRIDGQFAGLYQLRWLNLSDNRISNFDYEMIPRKLEWLDLHKNQVSALENQRGIEDQLSLTALDVSFNQLTSISSRNLVTSVENLLLNDNGITTVSQYSFFLLRNLSRVDLTSNRLSHVDQNALRINTETPTQFLMGGNPFICDCRMTWLHRYQQSRDPVSQYPQIADLDDIYCQMQFHRHMSHVPLAEANSSMFLCSYKRHCFAPCYCCEFDACDCEMTCPEDCNCYRDKSWVRNVVDCSRKGLLRIPTQIPMYATELYLDGNEFEKIPAHAFLGRKRLVTLHLNASKIRLFDKNAFAGLPNLRTLRLDTNEIEKLSGINGLNNLKELHLQNNELMMNISDMFSQLTNLETLRLDNNRLSEFSLWLLERNMRLKQIGIDGNPWLCDCHLLQNMKPWLRRNWPKLIGLGVPACFANALESTRGCDDRAPPVSAVPRNRGPSSTGGIVICLLTLAVLTCICAVLYMFRLDIGARLGVCCSKPLSPSEKPQQTGGLDVFIAFCDKDRAFVQGSIAPVLEFCDTPYRPALLHREYDGYHTDSIVEAVRSCANTIIVISKNFLDNNWCHSLFECVRYEVLKDCRKQLIVVVLTDVCYHGLSPQMKLILQSETCLRWKDELFWEKLFSTLSSPGFRTSAVSISNCSDTFDAKLTAAISPSGGNPPDY